MNHEVETYLLDELECSYTCHEGKNGWTIYQRLGSNYMLAVHETASIQDVDDTLEGEMVHKAFIAQLTQ